MARYQAGRLPSGDADGFARACGKYASNAATKAPNGTVTANAKRAKGSKARFARVPTGQETCTFCPMLAGRSAVYHTRKSAGEFRHFHRRCDCKVVPNTPYPQPS